jgi:Septum formation
VCGIAGLLLFAVVVPSIVALVLGLIAWTRARAAPGPGDGRGRALAGWIMGLIGVAGFAAILVTAIFTDDLDDDGRSVDDLRAGQCIDLDDGADVVSTVPEHDCDDPHDAEVYFVHELTGRAEYPGDAEVGRRASDVCTGHEFERYVGVAFDDSALEVRYMRPTELSWRQGDRRVVCAVVRRDGDALVGSVAGTGD